jgi:hypothetical protein
VQAASAETVTLNGLTNDYHITRNEFGVFSAQAGIGSNQRLGTFREDRSPGTADRRAILQFDLASLAGFASVTSATLSIFVPDQNSAIQTHDLDVWGSANRSATRDFGDAGAIGEFDAADYALAISSAIPSFNPIEDNRYYDSDLTGYLQARYADYVNNNALRYVFLRTQVEPPTGGTTNAFYELSSADSANVPSITVSGVLLVPLPTSAWAGLGGLVVCGGVVARRRSRQ